MARHFGTTLCATLCATLCEKLCATGLANDNAAKPNIVFIKADDCSYRDMQLYDGLARTPHLNQLAKGAMTFSRCYQAAPMCSPTRHALFTGIYPVKNGAHPNHPTLTCFTACCCAIARRVPSADQVMLLIGQVESQGKTDPTRSHSALDYVSPAEFEQRLMLK